MNNIWRLITEFKANIKADDFKVECEFTRNVSPDSLSFLKVWIRALEHTSFTIRKPFIFITLN